MQKKGLVPETLWFADDVGTNESAKAEIKGIFEHHTRLLTPEKLKKIVDKLSNGTLTNEEIFNDRGHGATVVDKINPEDILIAGPNRSLFKEYGKYAYPGGDVMITGCVGLLKAFEYNFSEE